MFLSRQVWSSSIRRLLAFVKCHVTSPVKWEVLRILASQDGAWMRADQLARSTHRPACGADARRSPIWPPTAWSKCWPAATPDEVSYRLPADEPTSVVLHRLIEAATHSQELRAIIAAHLQHVASAGAAVAASVDGSRLSAHSAASRTSGSGSVGRGSRSSAGRLAASP